MVGLAFSHQPQPGARIIGTLPVAVLLVALLGCSTAEPSDIEEGGTSAAPPTSHEEPPEPAATGQTTADSVPAYSADVRRIGPRLRERMRFSHRPGCPVRLPDLRYLTMSFIGFGGAARAGEMVVHESRVRAVVGVFRRLYEERWRIQRMRLVDDYRGDDDASMSANNTSGYNCRLTTSATRWSEHSYGRAIDVNPVQNPYVVGSTVLPEEGLRFARIDRSERATDRRGVIRSGDVVVSAFERIGWEWGGDWVNSKDYQHFSSSGR